MKETENKQKHLPVMGVGPLIVISQLVATVLAIILSEMGIIYSLQIKELKIPFIIIGIMLTGMLFGFLLRNKRLSWIHKIITLLIWVLLFLLGIDVGGNEAIIKGLHTLGLEALIITLAAVTGSILCAWGLWYLLYIRNRGKETEA